MSYPGYPHGGSTGYNQQQPNGAPTTHGMYPPMQKPVLPPAVNGMGHTTPVMAQNGSNIRPTIPHYQGPQMNATIGAPSYKMAPGPPPPMSMNPSMPMAVPNPSPLYPTPSMPMNPTQQPSTRPPPMHRMPLGQQPPQQINHTSRLPPPNQIQQPLHHQPMPSMMQQQPPPSMAPVQPPMMGAFPPSSMGGVPPPTSMGAAPQSMSGYSQPTPGSYPAQMTNQFGQMDLSQGNAQANQPIPLMQTKEAPVGPRKYQPSKIKYQLSAPPGISRVPPNRQNCERDVMCSTLNAIPSSDSLCQKAKLPFGLLLHPYKDLQTLPVITTSNIVRCRACRAYINPFVSFIDVSRWKCNLCGRVNEVPEEFKSNPITKEYGKPEERPECVNSTVEFIAPAEYMSRPPQAAQYLFLFDVSYNAVQSGYLNIVSEELLAEYKNLPGDRRTSIGFLCFDSALHFFNLNEDVAQPQQLSVSDIDDPFEPMPDSLMVNREACEKQIEEFLGLLPTMFNTHLAPESCAGSALTIAQKMMSKNGGRITVFSTNRINRGLGVLEDRKTDNNDSNEMLNGATDFYKTLAIEANQHHVAIDLFLMGHQFQDIASMAPISRNSAGQCFRYPGLHMEQNPIEAEKLRQDLQRYFTRKIGFEAVMRVRATRGISIHTFYGNFFVRSTDLVNLACISPDSGYAMRLQIDEDLKGVDFVGFQCALLYTSPRGDRRIRVHTMSLPVSSQLQDVFNNADAQMVASMLSHMAVDRSMSHSVADAREALLNAAMDALKSYRESLPSYQRRDATTLVVPPNLKPFPLYISALLKSDAFRPDAVPSDHRAFLMTDIKQQPPKYSRMHWHPDLYRVDNIADYPTEKRGDLEVPQADILPLSAQFLSRNQVFLMDIGWTLYLYIGVHGPQSFLTDVLGVNQFGQLSDGDCYDLPENPDDEADSELPDASTPPAEPHMRTLFRNFIISLQEDRSHCAPLQIIREDGQQKTKFISKLIQDRTHSQDRIEIFQPAVTYKYFPICMALFIICFYPTKDILFRISDLPSKEYQIKYGERISQLSCLYFLFL